MKDVYTILKDIKNTSSATGKQKIIEDSFTETDCFQTLIDTFTLALDPRIRFECHVDLEEIYKNFGDQQPKENKDLKQLYDYLYKTPSHRKDADKEFLVYRILDLSYPDRKVAEMVINKDLNIGINAKSINKVLSKLKLDHLKIYHFEPMKAYKERECAITDLEYPLIAQTKMDAARAYFVYEAETDEIKILSATGRKAYGLGSLENTVFDYMKNKGILGETSFCLDGEVIMLNEDRDGYESRKKSNGIFNKAIKGTISPEEADRFVMVVWDFIPKGESCLFEGYFETPYYDIDNEQNRFNWIKNFVNDLNSDKFRLVETTFVDNPAQAQVFADELIAEGEEGAILKERDLPYESKRTKKMVKVKKAYNADVRVTGINEGKNPGTLGSISYSTDDEWIQGDVSGIDDYLKNLWWNNPDEIIGKIIELRYMEVSTDKRRTDGVLTLYGPPVIVRERDMKDETDTLEKLT